jgi:hypothetical protein
MKRMRRLKHIRLGGVIDPKFLDEMRAATHPYWIKTYKVLDSTALYFNRGYEVELERH